MKPFLRVKCHHTAFFASPCPEWFRLTKSRARLLIRPRVLRDVSAIDTTVKLFGKTFAIPIGIAPSALHRLAGGDGELDTARAASSRGTAMCLSTNSTNSLEDVVKAAQEMKNPADLWFQLYVLQNRVHTAKMIKRAEGETAHIK